MNWVCDTGLRWRSSKVVQAYNSRKSLLCVSKNLNSINQSINQSNSYSANISDETRLSGPAAKSVFNSKIHVFWRLKFTLLVMNIIVSILERAEKYLICQYIIAF